MSKGQVQEDNQPPLPKRAFVKIVLSGMGRANKMRWIVVVILMLLLAGSTYLMPLVQKASMEEVFSGRLSQQTMLALVVLGVVVIIATITRTFISARINLATQKSLQLQMFANGIARSETADLRRGASGYISHVFGDAEQAGTLLATNLFENALIQGVLFATVLVTGSMWSWIFPASVLPAIVVTIIVWVFTAKRSNAAFAAFREQVVDTNPAVLEILEGRQTVLGYFGLHAALGALEQKFDVRDTEHHKVMGWTALGDASTAVANLIAQVTFFLLALRELQHGRLTVPELVALLAFLGAALGPLSAFKAAVDGFSRITVLRDRMKDALQRPTETALPNVGQITLIEARIPFLNEERGDPVTWTLDDRYCVVGGSGAGKTALLQVILGNRPPAAGACTWGDAQPAVDIPAEIRFKSVRYLAQTIDVFNRSAAFNVHFARRSTPTVEREEIFAETYESFADVLALGKTPDARSIDRFSAIGLPSTLAQTAAAQRDGDEARDLARQLAGLYTDATTFDADRYNRLAEQLRLHSFGERDLGPGGKQISGGERQRIGLARFLLPTYGTGFVLDEPFTSLDALTKETCIQTLIADCPQTPGLIVTHDIDLARTLGFDVLFVSSDGRFVTGPLAKVCQAEPTLDAIVSAFDRGGDRAQ